MNDINWKQKLSSRKFWAMLGGQLTAILTAFNASESVVLQIAAVVASVGSLCVYMLAEAKVDGKRTEGVVEIENTIRMSENDMEA